ncbi:MAG: PD-(D/E)XK nuclease-like domain-containing protein [Magnetococcales bacterium]|nr:PD-(D/E)XK nuclease-like domain-containing protein [Magnetococcales bacterium]
MNTSMVTRHPFGVHFNLPFDAYLADPALSQSGIKRLLVSPLTYWDGSHMNPKREPNDKYAMVLRHAIHKRILEGEAAYQENFAVSPRREDYPGALDGSADLKETCRAMGLKVTGTIAEYIVRIHSIDPDILIWPDIVHRFKEGAQGKELLKADDAALVDRMAVAVESDPEARAAFMGGFPEVSVFWPDPKSGVRMKARFDYLKPIPIVDLKSFTNVKNIPLQKAIVNFLGSYGGIVQAVLYLLAAKQAKLMINRGMIYGESRSNPIIQAFLNSKKNKFFFVFVETGTANNLIIREFPQFNSAGDETLLYQTGIKTIESAIQDFKSLSEQFGTNRWNVKHATRAFTDDEFPPWTFI